MADDAVGAGTGAAFLGRGAQFRGSGGTLFGIYVRNILLTILTLGIYYFWGKNRTRTYIVTQCEFEGDRFQWYGTGRELFMGFLRLLLFAAPLVFVIYFLPVLWKHPGATVVSTLSAYAAYLILFPIAAVGARRYRFSRLSWRGIRFSFRGRIRQFLKIHVKGIILSVITLGFYLPVFQTSVRRFVSEHSYYGNVRFSFDGRGRDLMGRYVVVLLVGGAAFVYVAYLAFLVIDRSFIPAGVPAGDRPSAAAVERLGWWLLALLLAVGVVMATWISYVAFRHRYFWGHTLIGDARFRSTVTGWKLSGLVAANLLLLVFTLGLALPWVLVRVVRFSLANITLTGPLDLERVVQEAQPAGAVAEELADVLNLDFLGFDLPL